VTTDAAGSPRVGRLIYRVHAAATISYFKTVLDPNSSFGRRYVGPPESVIGTTTDFQVLISTEGMSRACSAAVELITDFPTVEAARAAVEPYLQAWEIQSLVDHLAKHSDFSQPLRFEYHSAEVSNAQPTDLTVHVNPGHHYIEGEFPSPPSRLLASPDVRLMWQRWESYQAGRESLPAMAYYCLTALEAATGKSRNDRRSSAAAAYAVDIEVLNQLGDLVSEVGDDHERRKAHAKHRRPYTTTEKEWIERVVLALIERVGRVACGNATGTNISLRTLTLGDLPAI